MSCLNKNNNNYWYFLVIWRFRQGVHPLYFYQHFIQSQAYVSISINIYTWQISIPLLFGTKLFHVLHCIIHPPVIDFKIGTGSMN